MENGGAKEQEDLLCHGVMLSTEECRKAYQHWEQALIVKVLGKGQGDECEISIESSNQCRSQMEDGCHRPRE